MTKKWVKRYKWTGGLTMQGLAIIPGGGCTITRNGETVTIAGLQDLAAWLNSHPSTQPWEVDDICLAAGLSRWTAPPPFIAVDWEAPSGPQGVKWRAGVYVVTPLH